jgi:hypothetical protein
MARVERVDLRGEPMMPRRPSSFEEREPRSLATMRAAFGAYAFDAALRLALELAPKLEGDELREAHALAALSARGLDPHARGDDFGVGLAEAGLLGALDGEVDPRKRARWTLELCALHTRARAESGPANTYADQAVREAERAGGGYPLAWAHFARAEARRLAGQHDAATTELDAALALLAAPAVQREAPKALLDTTRALVANERARTASARAQRDELVHYRRLVDASLAALPPGERPGYAWLTPADDHADPLAVQAFHAGELVRARQALEPDDERGAARALAGAELCLGNAQVAKELLDVATRISEIIQCSADEAFALQLERIVAALRAGAWDDAERDLSLVRADPRCEGDVAQSEALAMLALVAAGKKDVPLLRERTTRALVQAEKSGSPGAVVRAGKLAADAWLAAEDQAQARAFAERARDALSAGVRAEDALGLMVTLLACGAGIASMVAEAADRAASSLDEVSAWWELPRLLPHVLRARALGVLVEGATLSSLIAAAAQRPDCASFVAELRAPPR